MSVRCLVIDDEPLAIRQMENYIGRTPDLELIHSFDNAVEAHKWLLEDGTVDVIFVDINMPELSGIEFVQQLENPPLIVFTTAYSEYAIDGFRLDAVGYLLKPFSFEEFSQVVLKVIKRLELLALQEKSEDAQDKECISIRADYKTSLVKFVNILYLESAGEYVRVHMTDKTEIVTLYRLKNMENLLPEDKFMRVHRSYIVNLQYVEGYTKGRVFLSGDQTVPIGDNYKEAFSEVVKTLG